MTQYARPDSDVTIDSWVVEPLFEKIDEATPSDGDYIESPDDTGTYTCEVGLGNVTDPVSSDDHVIKWRAARDGTGTKVVETRLYLYEGATQRAASAQYEEGASFAEHTYTLSSGEADAITDYTALRLRIEVTLTGTGVRVARVSWAEFGVPDVGGPPAAPSNLMLMGVG